MAKQKKLLTILAGLAGLVVVVGLVVQYNKESRAAVQKTSAAVPVSAAQIVVKTMPVRLMAIGNVEPVTTVAIKARADGQLISVKFKEGDEVRQGDTIFTGAASSVVLKFDDGQIAATSPDRGVEGGGEVRAGGREDHERDRPDADPDGGWMGAPPVQRDERRDPDQDGHDAQPRRVHLPTGYCRPIGTGRRVGEISGYKRSRHG